MKRIFIASLLFAVLCITLLLSCTAAPYEEYGYYDYNNDGSVNFADALSVLGDMLNTSDSDISILRVLHIMQGAVANTKIAATVTSVDTSSNTATISTEYCENVTLPLSMLGLDNALNEADYDGVPATIAVRSPASSFFDGYESDGKGIYLVRVNEAYTLTPANAVSKLHTISELNKNAQNGSHADDNYKTASLELNYRENVILSSDTTTYTRYDNAWYPRIRKVNDSLYLMTYMYGKYGQHLYYVTSADGINWNAPKVLWNSADYEAFTYTSGTLVGTSDNYHAVNPDICVLDDGSVICVYAVRAVKGYRYYPDYCGLFMKKGTNANGDIIWSDEVKIYTGQVWEPSVLQLENGEVHVYFTQVAPDITEFGYDEQHRSTETGLIISRDGGTTWVPNITAGDTNFYRANTIFREYVGDKDSRPHYSGQMPVATELSNGKLFVATEIRQLNGRFRISYGISDSAGAWDVLANNTESSYTQLDTPPTSSPYVCRFPSGEIYLTYNYYHEGADTLIGRLGKPDGSEFGNMFYNAKGSVGIWGSAAVINSHKAATVIHNKLSATTAEDGTETSIYGINIYYHYLNHRINAKKTSVILDGFINEWERNSDALFVGSETQAQSTVQIAHDRDNLYLLITRLDKYLTSKDTFTLNISTEEIDFYTVTVKVDGSYTVTLTEGGTTSDIGSGTTSFVKRFGTVDINTNADQGLFIEAAIPKSMVGLSGKAEFKAMPSIENKDAVSTVTTDTLEGADMTSSANWPSVILEK